MPDHASSTGVRLPARDVAIVALAARRAVGSKGIEVVGTSGLTGATVVIRALPGIRRDHVLLEIGAVPPLEAEGALDQRREPFLGARVAADVETERVERRAHGFDLHPGRLRRRLLRLPDEARRHHGHQHPDDDHYHHDLDQAEAPFALVACTHGPFLLLQMGKSLTLKIADSIDMTMNPTTSPITTSITGWRRLVNCAMARRTSRSK